MNLDFPSELSDLKQDLSRFEQALQHFAARLGWISRSMRRTTWQCAVTSSPRQNAGKPGYCKSAISFPKR